MAASEEVHQLSEMELKSTRVTNNQSLEYTRHVIYKESKVAEFQILDELDQQGEVKLDKNESDADLINTDDKVAKKDVRRRGTNFTKFWKKKNLKKENKNVWPSSWESEEEGRQIVDDRLSSSTGTGNSPEAKSGCQVTTTSSSKTTFSDRKVAMKKNIQQVSSLMDNFRGMAMDYAGALPTRYS